MPTPPQPFFEPPTESAKADDAVAEAPDLTAALWVRWRKDQDEAAREQLIGHYLPYARMVAATVYGRRTHNDVEFDDYLQLARMGLLEAVDRFVPGQGAQFKTFAAKRVQGAVLNGLTRLTEKNQQISVSMRLRQERLEAVKEAAAAQASEKSQDSSASAAASSRSSDKLFKYLAEVGIGLALGVLLEDTGMVDAEAFDGNGQAPSPEVSYFRKTEIIQLRTVLRDLVGQLSDQQKMVIRHHYLQEIPFDEIAKIMGVTRGRVSQLHRQGLLRLRELLGKDARCDVSW
ncbi:sigma-70 family RNA polymerase sigma factor [Variovorax sp. ZT5P49]|uniref:sigma-70 family RNA polymerase sigma factor n=1 Tax=Variovorax sp. ZT5P49 TaxID=3443733 RepID=UPI003F47938C